MRSYSKCLARQDKRKEQDKREKREKQDEQLKPNIQTTKADYFKKIHKLNFKYYSSKEIQIKIGDDTYYIGFNENDEYLPKWKLEFLRKKIDLKFNQCC